MCRTCTGLARTICHPSVLQDEVLYLKHLRNFKQNEKRGRVTRKKMKRWKKNGKDKIQEHIRQRNPVFLYGIFEKSYRQFVKSFLALLA